MFSPISGLTLLLSLRRITTLIYLNSVGGTYVNFFAKIVISVAQKFRTEQASGISGVSTMVNINELLPNANDIKKQAALKEAEKAEAHARQLAAAEAEKHALIEELTKPSGLSEEEKIKRASTVIQRAVRNGLSEIQVYRFPNIVCTDRGRAINQMEPGWENTLTGVPKEIYQLWKDYLQPRGYKISYQVIDFPGGVPGDIGITLSWS